MVESTPTSQKTAGDILREWRKQQGLDPNSGEVRKKRKHQSRAKFLENTIPIDDIIVPEQDNVVRKSMKQEIDEANKKSVAEFSPNKVFIARKQNASESVSPDDYARSVRFDDLRRKEQKEAEREKFNAKVESLREKGQSPSNMNTLKGAGLLVAYTGLKAGQGAVRSLEFVSPVDFRGNAQIPIVTPTYNFGKYLLSGRYIGDFARNPLGTSAEFFGASVTLGKSPLKRVAEAETNALMFPIKNSPKFTRMEVIGGTEQYLKYGDNRINKQFLSKNLGPDFKMIGPRYEGTSQLNLFGEDFRTLRNRVQPNNVKNLLNPIETFKNKEVQMTLDNKRAYSSFIPPDEFTFVKDVKPSVQKQIKFVDVLDVDVSGKIKASKGFKLVDVKPLDTESSTSLLSTQVNKKQGFRDPLDELAVSGGRDSDMFKFRSSKSINREISSYNQQLLLFDLPETGRRVPTSSPSDVLDISPIRGSKVITPVSTNFVPPITMSMSSSSARNIESPMRLTTFNKLKLGSKPDIKVGTGLFRPPDNALSRVLINDLRSDTRSRIGTIQRTRITQKTGLNLQVIPIQRITQNQIQKTLTTTVSIPKITQITIPRHFSSSYVPKREPTRSLNGKMFKLPRLRLSNPRISFSPLSSLPEVFSFEQRTNREAGIPKSKRARRIFANQLYGLGDFNRLIKVERGY